MWSVPIPCTLASTSMFLTIWWWEIASSYCLKFQFSNTWAPRQAISSYHYYLFIPFVHFLWGFLFLVDFWSFKKVFCVWIWLFSVFLASHFQFIMYFCWTYIFDIKFIKHVFIIFKFLYNTTFLTSIMNLILYFILMFKLFHPKYQCSWDLLR